MENTISLETKYQNLAAEYSKLRANATVLKKAVIDEQARSRELKESLKEHEQRLRKSNQEMESLTFRNQQLTKRISVLQDELMVKNNKRVRGKSVENCSPMPSNVTLLDEELQKKIMDNAQLISAMADKDLEISNLREQVSELQEKVHSKEDFISDLVDKHKIQIKELKHSQLQKLKECEAKHASISSDLEARQNGDAFSDKLSTVSSEEGHVTSKQLLQLEQEKERWKTEYELLLALQEELTFGEDKTVADKMFKMKEFFYKRIDNLIADKQDIQSVADSLAAECNALQVRLELSLEEKTESEQRLESSICTLGRLQEELNTTSHNYEQQLSTMSEHLADLNDKYTEQCELIQQLQYQLGIKGKKK